MSLIISNRKAREPLRTSNPDALRAYQAAEFANVSIGTIYNWLPLLNTWTVNRPGVKRGIRFISKSSLEDLLKKMTKEGI
jgi:hypothetical protein